MGWNTVARFTANFMLSLAMVLGYVAVGAVFFVSLEWETEQEDTRQARFMLNDFKDRYNLTSDNITDFLKTFAEMNRLRRGQLSDEAPREIWTFEGAFYFCTTAITTIGTGNIVPATSMGRWFCIIYVLIGIPLLTLFFGMTGYYLTQLLRLAILKIEGCLMIRMTLFWRQCTFAVITWVIGTICLCLYAVWMAYSVGWTIPESIYFSLTTFSTIGFGDYSNYNGAPKMFPLVISSFIVLTLMLPASSLLFSTTAELFQTLVCPIYIKSGLVKKTELQRILAEDQMLYRYRKKRNLPKYEKISNVPKDESEDARRLFPEQHSDNDEIEPESSLGYDVIREYLLGIESNGESGEEGPSR